MKSAFLLIAACFLLLSLHPAPAPADQTDLQIAVAWRLVNPAAPQVPVGHRGTRRYIEVHEDLRVHAVLFRDAAGKTILWLAWDICMLEGPQVDQVKQAISKKHRIPPESICVNASHTHSAPATTPEMLPDPEYFDPAYAKYFLDQAVAVVDDAMQNLKPARLRYADYPCASVAINRRLKVGDELLMKPNFAGPVDHRAQVLAAEDPASGKLLAVLVKYACHPVTVGPKGLGSDFPGFMRRFLESRHPGAVAVFLQGCCADVRIQIVNEKADDFVSEDPVAKARQFGRDLGAAVECALAKPGIPLAGPLDARSKILSLPVVVPPESEYRAALQNKNYKLWGQTYCDLLDKGKPIPAELPFQIQSFQFRLPGGEPFLCLALESEVFTEYGFRIAESLRQPNAITLGYSNRITGYVPTRQAFSEGGYEVADSYKYDPYMPGPYRSDVESILLSAIADLVK